MIIESCCTSLEQALSAQKRGAGRIELCTDLSVGGVTPSRELIREIVAALTIPVNVLVRDRQCLDFVYDDTTIHRMIDDIVFCREAGVAGIVIGALTPDGHIDIPAMHRMIKASAPLPVTFHRAFDVCKEDPFEALKKVIDLGCKRLLTSGQAANAWEGRETLAELVKMAGERIIVMPGCGVRPDNLETLREITQAKEFHGTAIPGTPA